MAKVNAFLNPFVSDAMLYCCNLVALCKVVVSTRIEEYNITLLPGLKTHDVQYQPFEKVVRLLADHYHRMFKINFMICKEPYHIFPSERGEGSSSENCDADRNGKFKDPHSLCPVSGSDHFGLLQRVAADTYFFCSHMQVSEMAMQSTRRGFGPTLLLSWGFPSIPIESDSRVQTASTRSRYSYDQIPQKTLSDILGIAATPFFLVRCCQS
ncbi:hypothetical protein F5Y18DRAFT_425188 [Xylariaceae sp. FL1019]|nr:hypothetical protein F5Y18DRAFT_425188 [Xylariaceae sp. FL1019]